MQRILGAERDVHDETLMLERVGGLDADQRLVLDHQNAAGVPIAAVALTPARVSAGTTLNHGTFPLLGALLLQRGAHIGPTPSGAIVSNLSKG
jgi:hypothetical protein